uniref:Uncharacterized protein n=1 Tax=Anguilla anguilla TaxID=7936 RepID=A0A0E9PVG5_ANGAN
MHTPAELRKKNGVWNFIQAVTPFGNCS